MFVCERECVRNLDKSFLFQTETVTDDRPFSIITIQTDIQTHGVSFRHIEREGGRDTLGETPHPPIRNPEKYLVSLL